MPKQAIALPRLPFSSLKNKNPGLRHSIFVVINVLRNDEPTAKKNKYPGLNLNRIDD